MIKKCLFIANRPFWPPNSGHEVALYHYCKELHEKYKYNITLYLFSSSSIKESPDFIAELIIAKNITKLGKIINIAKCWLSNRPLQTALMVSRANQICITELSKKNNYDLIIVDMIRLASYIECLNNQVCKKVLIVEDLLSDRYRRVLNVKDSKGSVMGYYQNTLPSVFNKLLDIKALKRYVLSYEANAIDREQSRYIQLYSYFTLIAQKDAVHFNETYKTSKALRLGLGVDIDYFSQRILEVDKDQNGLCFIGNMYVAANQDSVRYIGNQVLPKISSRVVFNIIGSVPEQFMKKINNKSVVFHGRVEDMRSICNKSKIFLAPIVYGTGIKTKIIEAMAMGLPVVTNSIGAESIDAENYKDFICEDDPDIIANQIDNLLNDESLARQIAKNGREFARNNFDWRLVLKKFDDMEL